MTTETEITLPDLDGLDPDSLFRAFALGCSVMTCGPASSPAHVLAVAASYFDFVSPFSMDETTFKLEPKA